ncbi:MAG: hypothetical protein LBV11_07010 [Bacillus cereus]|jgi:hypothetical protein|nr:hypothetical protein [Bacillus cereus]
MNKFKHSAFIENTPEMRGWLDELGYHSNYIYAENGVLYTHNDSRYIGLIENIRYENIIDCRQNPALFKALTAIRHDSDYMQYFVTEADHSWINLGMYSPKGSFELCLMHKRVSDIPAHKATLEELIEHFKK